MDSGCANALTVKRGFASLLQGIPPVGQEDRSPRSGTTPAAWADELPGKTSALELIPATVAYE